MRKMICGIMTALLVASSATAQEQRVPKIWNLDVAAIVVESYTEQGVAEEGKLTVFTYDVFESKEACEAEWKTLQRAAFLKGGALGFRTIYAKARPLDHLCQVPGQQKT